MAGLYWWCEQAFNLGIASLTFTIECHWEVPTTYEPIEGGVIPRENQIICIPSWSFDWVGEALNYQGFSANWNGVFAHCDHLRQQYHARWAFEMYLVSAENDEDHFFQDLGASAYTKYYAYLNYCQWTLTGDAPVVVLGAYSSDPYPELGYRHEIGHVFGAWDEYEQQCSDCSQKWGYLWVPNGNCEACNENAVMCIMRYRITQPCFYTRGQIGWRDSDADSIPDAIKPDSGRYAFIEDLQLGDIIRIYTVAGEFVTSISVDHWNYNESFHCVVWDGLNCDAQTCYPTIYIYKVNDGSEQTLILHVEDPNVVPSFSVSNYYPQTKTINWHLRNSWAYVRAFVYDSEGNLVAWPVWDELYLANEEKELDLSYIENGDGTYTVRFTAWRPGVISRQTFSCHVGCMCGDFDDNGIWNVSDPTALLAWIFGGGDPPRDECLADADGDCNVNISDAAYLISFIFGGGPAPACNTACEY